VSSKSRHPDNPATYGLPPVLRATKANVPVLCVGVPEFVARWYVRDAREGVVIKKWNQRKQEWQYLTDTEARKWQETLDSMSG
jgi:hypothetical protein